MGREGRGDGYNLKCDGVGGVTATIRDDNGKLVQEVFVAPKTKALQLFPEVRDLK